MKLTDYPNELPAITLDFRIQVSWILVLLLQVATTFTGHVNGEVYTFPGVPRNSSRVGLNRQVQI